MKQNPSHAPMLVLIPPYKFSFEEKLGEIKINDEKTIYLYFIDNDKIGYRIKLKKQNQEAVISDLAENYEIKEGHIKRVEINEEVFNDLQQIFAKSKPSNIVYQHRDILLKKILELTQEEEIWSCIESQIRQEKIGWILPDNDAHARIVYEGYKQKSIPVIRGGGQAVLAEKLRQLRNRALKKTKQEGNTILEAKIRNYFRILPISTSYQGGNNKGANALQRGPIDRDLKNIKKHLDRGWSIWGLGDERFLIGGGISSLWFNETNASIFGLSQGEYVDQCLAFWRSLYNSGENASEIIAKRESQEGFLSILTPEGDFRITCEEYHQLAYDDSYEGVIIQENYALIDHRKRVLRKPDQPFLLFNFRKNDPFSKLIVPMDPQDKDYVGWSENKRWVHDNDRYLKWVKANPLLKKYYEKIIKDRVNIYKTIGVTIIVESLVDLLAVEDDKELQNAIIKLQLQLLRSELSSLGGITEFHLASVDEDTKKLAEDIFDLNIEETKKRSKVQFFLDKENPVLVARKLTMQKQARHRKGNLQFQDRKIAVGTRQDNEEIKPLLLIPSMSASVIQEIKEKKTEETEKETKKEKGKEKVQESESEPESTKELETVSPKRKILPLNELERINEEKLELKLVLARVSTLRRKVILFKVELPSHPLSKLMMREEILEQLENYRVQLFSKVPLKKIDEIKKELRELEDAWRVATSPKETQIQCEGLINKVKNAIKQYIRLRNLTFWCFASDESRQAIKILQEIIETKDVQLLYTEIIQIICTHPEKRFSEVLVRTLDRPTSRTNKHSTFEQIRLQAITEGKVITFLRGRSRICPDHDNPTFCLSVDESYFLTNKFLEDFHHFIQHLFPNKEGSEFNDKALIWTQKASLLVQRNPQLASIIEKKLIKNLQRMLRFYGFKIIKDVNDKLNVLKAQTFERRAKNTFYWNNHNYLRITRIFKILELQKDQGNYVFPNAAPYAQAFRNALQKIAKDEKYEGKISDKTLYFWGIGHQYEEISTPPLSAFALGLRDLILTNKISENAIDSFLHELRAIEKGNPKANPPPTLFPPRIQSSPVNWQNQQEFIDYLRDTKEESLLEHLVPAIRQLAINFCCNIEKRSNVNSNISPLGQIFLANIKQFVRAEIKKRRDIEVISSQEINYEHVFRNMLSFNDHVESIVKRLEHNNTNAFAEEGSSGTSNPLSIITSAQADLHNPDINTAEEIAIEDIEDEQTLERRILAIIAAETPKLMEWWNKQGCRSFFKTEIDNEPFVTYYTLPALADFFQVSLKLEDLEGSRWLFRVKDAPEMHFGRFDTWKYYRNVRDVEQINQLKQEVQSLKRQPTLVQSSD